MYDKQRVDDLIQDIISAGRFQGADMLELARASYVVAMSCEVCIAANVDGFDSKMFEQRLDNVKAFVESHGTDGMEVGDDAGRR